MRLGRGAVWLLFISLFGLVRYCLGSSCEAEGMAEVTMRAVVLESFGGPEVLAVGEAPRPVPEDGEVLVRVEYSAINRADTLQRKGGYKPPPGASEILGLEFSGVVVESRDDGSLVGKRVCALVTGGGYAEYITVPKDLLMFWPDDIPMDVAAGFPEAYLTAFQALFLVAQGKLTEAVGSADNQARRVLVHAGASGVGSSAIQILKRAGVGQIIVTAGSAEKLTFCKALGADVGINYKEQAFDEAVKAATDGQGVDVVLDFIGQKYWEQNLESLAPDGAMVMLGFLSGPKLDGPSNLAPILRKRLNIHGSTLRARSNEYKADLTRRLWAFTKDGLLDGSIQVKIDSTFAMADARLAHEHMEANKNSGKIILKIA
mmetsp:Transcript_31084/g.87120  ORF Transcript_31084/g.87120 Transcript_31084/m.87120 type:complete len:374 (-) Transcript_31084:60-1181(-)